MIVFIQIIGLFIGVLSRTLLPFLRKLYRGKIKSFKRKYIYPNNARFADIIYPLVSACARKGIKVKGRPQIFHSIFPVYQSIGALFLLLIIFFLIFPQYHLGEPQPAGALVLFKFFCVSFAFGFGFNSLIVTRKSPAFTSQDECERLPEEIHLTRRVNG